MVLSAGALSVGVLVDLPWRTQAGGHVKCWERFAQAATTLGDDLEIPLDLTIHFLGDEPGEKSSVPRCVIGSIAPTGAAIASPSSRTWPIKRI